MVVRVLAVIAAVAATVSAVLGAHLANEASKSSRLQAALQPAADVFVIAQVQIKDHGAPRSPTPPRLVWLQHSLVSSLQRVDNLVRGTNIGSAVEQKIEWIGESEIRWWTYRTTGRLPPPPPPIFIPGTSESYRKFRTEFQSLFDINPKSVRPVIVIMASQVLRGVIVSGGSAQASYASARREWLAALIPACILLGVSLMFRWWRIITHINMPVVRIVRQFGMRPPVHFRRLRSVPGWIGVMLSSTLFIIGPIVAFFIIMKMSIVPARGGVWWLWEVVAVAAGIGGYKIGFRIWKNARRQLPPNVRPFLALDGRLPVLYLRSFRADRTTRGFVGLRTGEENLVRVFSNIGPAVAIGHPRERSTPLGAARLYLSDTDWRPVVTSLLKVNALVVLVVGKSRGIQWELETTVRVVTPERLLLLITPDSDLTMLQRVLPKGLPKDLSPVESASDRWLSAVISFNDGWEPYLKTSPLILPELAGYPSYQRLSLRNVLTSDHLAFAGLAAAGFFIALQCYSLLLQYLPGLPHYTA